MEPYRGTTGHYRALQVTTAVNRSLQLSPEFADALEQPQRARTVHKVRLVTLGLQEGKRER